MALPSHWFDRITAPIAPRWTLRRQYARVAADLMARHYEASAGGRRTKGWNKSSTDANVAIGAGLARLRDQARDLVRNNGYAEAALSTIVDQAVGWGITAKPAPRNQLVLDVWKAWAESTDCDADGRTDFAGLQKLVMRTVAESGEVLVRRRLRLPSDGLAIPVQLQVLEPDFLDTSKDVANLPNGGRIIQGVEFDAIGRRAGYWVFKEHPGSNFVGGLTSYKMPAESVLHIFRALRPGQVRGPSWFADVILPFRDFDEYEDATLMKQKIAACLAVITTDIDGTSPPLGLGTDSPAPGIDSLEPGMIMNVPPGREIKVVDPPTVREYADYAKSQLRKIAAGLGVTYEDMTGNYDGLPFSAARMSRIRRWAHVEDDRWRLLIPQFCDPAWGWAMQAAQVMNLVPAGKIAAEWTAPPMPMIEPDREGLAYMRNIRAGIITQSEAIRERGYDPDQFFAEMAADNDKLDKWKLVLDSDPRKMTQAGQAQQAPKPAAVPAVNGNGSGNRSDMMRFADWLGRQKGERVVEVLDAMFGERRNDSAR